MAVPLDAVLNLSLKPREVLVVYMQIHVCVPVQHAAKLVRAQQNSICYNVSEAEFPEDLIDVEEEVPHGLLAAGRNGPTSVDPVGHRAVCDRQVTAKMPHNAIRAHEVAKVVRIHEKLCLQGWSQPACKARHRHCRHVVAKPGLRRRNSIRDIGTAIEVRSTEALRLADVNEGARGEGGTSRPAPAGRPCMFLALAANTSEL
mmetsp:Transcript_28237/g.61663  ORF Transcript_28237/g.61663 Transcript_28237/m.61663 type:complete len:202 (+) Transcript_28237:261-866(+)